MNFLSRYIFLILIVFSPLSFGQVLLIQWTDAHSTLQSMTRQIYVIDQMAQDFKLKNPKGEVVIYIIGDFTSIVATVDDKGWLSFKAIELLRNQGHTVLFTPGNHDAFDWINSPKDIDLFIQQMQRLKQLGVTILAENFSNKTPLWDSLVSPSYPLTTIEATTHIVGLTLSRIYDHSNLNPQSSTVLFKTVESYDQTLNRILLRAKKALVKRIFLGVHDGHKKVSNIAKSKDFMKTFGVSIPLLLAAHDHFVVSYREKESLILDAGSHGSFNAIEIAKTGEILNVQHISLSPTVPQNGKNRFLFGSIKQNKTSLSDIQNSWLKDYEQEIQDNLLDNPDIIIEIKQNTKNGGSSSPFTLGSAQQIQSESAKRVVAFKQDIKETKQDMQYGPSFIGKMMADTLTYWVQTQVPSAKIVIALFNSSSYRLDKILAKGPINKSLLHDIYPYGGPAKFYKLRGSLIEKLYFSLRKDYKARSADNTRYSPQLNTNTREFKNRLQIKVGEVWKNIKRNKKYFIVMDPWLAKHEFGGSYKIKEWLEILEERPPAGLKNFQDILAEFFHEVLRENQQVEYLLPKKSQTCRDTFE